MFGAGFFLRGCGCRSCVVDFVQVKSVSQVPDNRLFGDPLVETGFSRLLRGGLAHSHLSGFYFCSFSEA